MHLVTTNMTSQVHSVKIMIKFAVVRMLPKIDIEKFIVIHDTGAHGFAMGYNYNGKLKSAEIFAAGRRSRQKLIRRAETHITLQHLIALRLVRNSNGNVEPHMLQRCLFG